jgi:hypothetical protein
MDELSKTHLAYWQRHNILSAQAIARMRDIEFTCELTAAMLEGLQNQKSIIPVLYRRYDQEFPQGEFIGPRFADILGFCERILGGTIAGTEFSKLSLFYSLFVAAYDIIYGLRSDQQGVRKIENEAGFLTSQERLLELNEALSEEGRPVDYAEFYDATRQSTDKIQQRTIRHRKLTEILTPSFNLEA